MACDISVAETIETLTERLLTSTLPQDRRDACRGLKSLAKDYRVQVGAQAMEPLLQTIKTHDREDTEMMRYCLNTLNYVISGPLADTSAATWPDPDTSSTGGSPHDPGRELAEIFLKRAENLATIVEMTRDEDLTIRWTIVQIICALARHNLEMVQDSILSDPLNLSRLVTLINSKSELIKNDAIALFVRITRANHNIQNVLAYENFFDTIMRIIECEDYLGGVVAVVHDCLNILMNMTQHNEANQKLFRENKHIPKLMPFFDSIQTIEWDPLKTGCMVLVLQIADSMLSPSNSPEHIRKSQDVLRNCGILDKLCDMMTASSLPFAVLYEIMNTASDIVKGNLGILGDIVMPTSSAMPILMLGMVKDMCQVQEERISELYNYMHTLHDYISKPPR